MSENNAETVFEFGAQYQQPSISNIEQTLNAKEETPVGYSNGVDGKHYTLIFCRRKCGNDEDILLGMKKRGVGMGKWNGFGGKVEPGESIDDATKRELEEESSVIAGKITKRGYIVETVDSTNMKFYIHVYDCWEFNGEATETEEMRPQWYNINELPWKSMWCDDQYWFPLLLNNISIFTGRFTLSDEETMKSYVIIDHTGHVNNATLKPDFDTNESDSDME